MYVVSVYESECERLGGKSSFESVVTSVGRIEQLEHRLHDAPPIKGIHTAAYMQLRVPRTVVVIEHPSSECTSRLKRPATAHH